MSQRRCTHEWWDEFACDDVNYSYDDNCNAYAFPNHDDTLMIACKNYRHAYIIAHEEDREVVTIATTALTSVLTVQGIDPSIISRVPEEYFLVNAPGDLIPGMKVLKHGKLTFTE